MSGLPSLALPVISRLFPAVLRRLCVSPRKPVAGTGCLLTARLYLLCFKEGSLVSVPCLSGVSEAG